MSASGILSKSRFAPATVSCRRRLTTCKVVAFRPSKPATPGANKQETALQSTDEATLTRPIMYLSQASANLLQRFSEPSPKDEQEYVDWSWFPTESGSHVHTSAALQHPVNHDSLTVPR